MLTWIFKYKINTKSDLITSSPGYISFLSCLLCHVVFEHVTAIPPAHLRVLNLVCLRIWVFCRPCDISVTRAWLVKPRQDAGVLMMSRCRGASRRVSGAPDTEAPGPGVRTAGAGSAQPWSWTPCRSSRTGSRPRPGRTRRSSLRASSERRAI